MSARDAILGKVRRSLAAGAEDAQRRSAVAARLSDHPRGVVPKRGHLPKDERIALFEEQAVKANATVAHVAGYGDLPEAVSSFLRDKNLPAAVRMGADPRLASAPWAGQKTLEIHHGASDGEDASGVSHAFAGIAETGTLALTSGQDNPTTVNFLPENHIVVVAASDVLPDLETVWQNLRAARGTTGMPRTVNLVTGPSRSGDIEQVLLLGAHGPRALHIVIVDEA